jgi:hypothetical protein
MRHASETCRRTALETKDHDEAKLQKPPRITDWHRAVGVPLRWEDRRYCAAFDAVLKPGSGWIAVDLDGTLAHYDRAAGPDHIGAPVPAMAMRVRTWLSEGRDVRIFTARACIPELIEPVKAWCARHFGVRLPVTNAKDFGMIELWDDRCIQVRINTGQRVVNP